MPQGESTEGRPELDALQSRLGTRIDPELLTLALTHRSFAYENGGLPHNERLEFLGDSILGQAVTVRLYRDHPDLDEGALAKRRASVVSGVALAEVARGLGLGEFLRLGRGEQLSGGGEKVSILADTVEAIIGATYLSAGPDEATELVMRLVGPLMRDSSRFGVALDPKTALQELADQRHASAPVYDVVGTGPDHSKVFRASVEVAGLVTGHGEGSSKKHAEMAAALDAWTQVTGASA